MSGMKTFVSQSACGHRHTDWWLTCDVPLDSRQGRSTVTVWDGSLGEGAAVLGANVLSRLCLTDCLPDHAMTVVPQLHDTRRVCRTENTRHCCRCEWRFRLGGQFFLRPDQVADHDRPQYLPLPDTCPTPETASRTSSPRLGLELLGSLGLGDGMGLPLG